MGFGVNDIDLNDEEGEWKRWAMAKRFSHPKGIHLPSCFQGSFCCARALHWQEQVDHGTPK